jgi:hypothetical protein
MIPFLMVVERLQTASDAGDVGGDAQFPYTQLRAELSPDDVWDWSLLVLRTQSLCVSVKTHFVSVSGRKNTRTFIGSISLF